MKKALSIAGFLVLGIIALWQGYFLGSGGAVKDYVHKADERAKPFVNSVVPKIIGDWNRDALLNNSNAYLVTMAYQKGYVRSSLANSFYQWKTLGKLKSYKSAEINNAYPAFLNRSSSEQTIADYKIAAEFEKGPAEIEVSITDSGSDDWKIQLFEIKSPAFQ